MVSNIYHDLVHFIDFKNAPKLFPESRQRSIGKDRRLVIQSSRDGAIMVVEIIKDLRILLFIIICSLGDSMKSVKKSTSSRLFIQNPPETPNHPPEETGQTQKHISDSPEIFMGDEEQGPFNHNKYLEEENHLDFRGNQSPPFLLLGMGESVNQFDITPIFGRIPPNLNSYGLEKSINNSNPSDDKRGVVGKKLDFGSPNNNQYYPPTLNEQTVNMNRVQIPLFEQAAISPSFNSASEQQYPIQPAGSKKPRNKKNGTQSLKNLALNVVEIVKKIKVGTYKDIADELVEIILKQSQRKSNENVIEAKQISNAKRRVYDALNILVSTNILKREGKKVLVSEDLEKSKALQAFHSKSRLEKLREEVAEKRKSYKNKIQKLFQLYFKYVAVSNLRIRNSLAQEKEAFIFLPFVSVNYPVDTEVVVTSGENSLKVSMNKAFRMAGDVDVITQLGLHRHHYETKQPEWMTDISNYIQTILHKTNHSV